MKHFLIIFLIILCPLTIFATQAPVKGKVKSNAESKNLIINITGFKTNQGVARIALVDSKQNYDNDKNLRQKIIPVKDKKAQYIVKNLEFGKYAVKVFHDENSNGKLDTAIFGIPTEAYGFSNNARGKFGAPDYSKVVFEFNTQDQEIFIKVK